MRIQREHFLAAALALSAAAAAGCSGKKSAAEKVSVESAENTLAAPAREGVALSSPTREMAAMQEIGPKQLSPVTPSRLGKSSVAPTKEVGIAAAPK